MLLLTRLVRPCFRGAAAIALLALTASVCAAQQPDWTRRQPLPAPNGRYAVGTATLRLEDRGRATSHHIATRPLRVQVWYPARSGSSALRAPYIGEPGLLDSMINRGYMDLPKAQMQPWAAVKLFARLNATPAKPPRANGWPVLVFSHGMGASRVSYASYVQQLASHGYVVLAIDHPMGGFTFGAEGQVLTPGVDSVPYPYPRVLGPLLRDWAKDASFVVRTVQASLAAASAHGLRIPLDTLRVGMVGHSLGGAAALQACLAESLFVACADMDGDTFGDVDTAGVGKPFLILLSQPVFALEPQDSAGGVDRERLRQMGRERDSSWTATVAKQPGIPAYVVKVSGTGHMSFSDAPFLFPSAMQNTSSTMERARAYRLISARLLDFFDHYLNGSRLRTLEEGTSVIP